MSVKVRFAPSPTGYLHVGGARTALYNYLYAKRFGGKFILRIEDTDQERSTEQALQMQLQDLKWLGLKWDEGPEVGGPHGPYKQSERLDIYKKYANEILDKGKAYYCFLTDEEIEKQREEAMKAGRPPQVQSPYRDWSQEKALAEIKKGKKAVVRFRVPHQVSEYTFPDVVRGDMKFASDMVGDFVLLRSDGMPVYNFCCVIDDHLMEITHVLRAEDHLSNTLRQMMIYEALGWKTPVFAHLSFILGPDKQKLSKRHGSTSCNEFRKRGFLPEALNNFIALLGWSSPKGQEIISMDELAEQFDLDRMVPSPAVFDETKLLWVNETHLRALPNSELWKRLVPFLDEAGVAYSKDSAWQSKSLDAFKSAMKTLVDGVTLFGLLDDDSFSVYEESREALGWAKSENVISTWSELVKASGKEYLTAPEFEAIQNQVKEKCQVKGKELFMPIRVSVIGKPHGTELKLLVPLLKVDSLVQRANQTIRAGKENQFKASAVVVGEKH